MKPTKIIPNYKYFDSQEDDEQVVFVLRRHWTILAVPFFIGAVILILTAAIVLVVDNLTSIELSATGQTIFISIISLIILYTTLYMFIAWLIRYLNIVILTGEHLVEIKQLAIFSRKVSELDLDCIEDATASQKGFIETIFRFGSVMTQTAGELPNFDFQGIADPNEVQQKIMETKEAYMKSNLYNHNNSAPAQMPEQQNIESSSPIVQ